MNHYFEQRSETDCLTTCIENLLQVDRSIFPDLEYYYGKFLSYKSVFDIFNHFGLNNHFSVFATSHMVLQKESIPMILGVNLRKLDEKAENLHAIFWDGMFAWEAWNKKFLDEDFSELKIVYAIIPHCYTKLNETGYNLSWLKDWDKNIPLEPIDKNKDETKIPYGYELDYLITC